MQSKRLKIDMIGKTLDKLVRFLYRLFWNIGIIGLPIDFVEKEYHQDAPEKKKG